VQLIQKVIARANPKLEWLTYSTFFGGYEPSLLACEGAPGVVGGSPWTQSLWYDGPLLGLAAAALAIAAVIFCRRDLPAPL